MGTIIQSVEDRAVGREDAVLDRIVGEKLRDPKKGSPEPWDDLKETLCRQSKQQAQRPWGRGTGRTERWPEWVTWSSKGAVKSGAFYRVSDHEKDLDFC